MKKLKKSFIRKREAYIKKEVDINIWEGGGVGTWPEGGQGREVQGGKVPAGRLRGFKPLKVISKYISFKGLKGRDLL